MKKILIIFISCILITLVILGANYVMETSTDTSEPSTEEKVSEDFIVDKRPEEWSEYVFPEDEVIEIRIYMDEDQYDYMVENASSELYVPADIVYNGLTLENIGIRPKGNSSLRTAISEGKEQFSFKLKFDEYISQNLFGLTAIGLNNCTSDSSYIREIMSYEIIEEMGLPVPGTTFCNVYINDELAGLYLSVQQIDEVFTAAWFDEGDGDLYKPEGTGANLVYIDDDYSSYSGLGERTNIDEEGEEAVVTMIKALNTGEDLEEVLYTDLILKYHALNTAMLSLDSYMGGMFHNYYLYGEEGKYMIIPWDYNLSFGGFGSGMNQSDSDETQFYIDEPTSGAMENYPLINALLSNDDYLEQYHEYLCELITGPLEIEQFTARAEELTTLIDTYIKDDPEPITSYEDFKSALYDTVTETENFDIAQSQESTTETPSNTEELPQMENFAGGMKRGMGGGPALLSFVESWTENIYKQLSGELASTNNGEGNQAGMMAGKMGAFDLDEMANMEDGGRPQMRNGQMQPPDGMERDGNFPQPPDGFQMGENPPELPAGMDMKEMQNAFEDQEGAPDALNRASLGFNFSAADISKCILMIIAAFFVMMFAWMIKKKN